MARPNSTDLDLFDSGVLARLNGVDSGYGSANVLVGLDFEARAGEVALVTGPAAAGKTTLMHLLRLALTPRNGRAVILGWDVGRIGDNDRARLKRRIGYVAETPDFVEGLSAFENIALPLRLAGKRPREFAVDVRELVDFVGLGGAADLPIERLSGAERRRAAIARALANKPNLILADDPTAGMSPGDGRRIVRLLAEMRRVGAGVIMTSQDETLADAAPTTLWRIERGRIARVSQPSQAEEEEAFE